MEGLGSGETGDRVANNDDLLGLVVQAGLDSMVNQGKNHQN